MNIIKKAVVLCAGHGKRMSPYTNVIPKELLSLGNYSVLEVILNELKNSEIKEVLIVLSESKNLIFQCVYEWKKRNRSDIKVFFTFQSGLYGTAGWIEDALPFCNEDFALIYPDMIVSSRVSVIKQLSEIYYHFDAEIIATKRIPSLETENYGWIEQSDKHKVIRIREKELCLDGAFAQIVAGRFIIKQNSLKLLSAIQPVNGELRFTDIINEYALKNDVYSYEYSGKTFDTGNINDYRYAVNNYKEYN